MFFIEDISRILNAVNAVKNTTCIQICEHNNISKCSCDYLIYLAEEP